MRQSLCICLVVAVAIAALVVLFYFLGSSSPTGAVSTGICPPGSAVVYAEGRGVYVRELESYIRLGHRCIFGYDGITPCCYRTSDCCLPTGEWAKSPTVGYPPAA